MRIYPTSPFAHEQLGRHLIQFGENQADMQAIAQGIDQLTEALRLNDQRPPDEIRRYTKAQLDAINTEINRARQLGALLSR